MSARGFATVMLAGFAAVSAAGGADAQGLPAWSIEDICAKEAGHCAAFEARAREAVSGSWGVLPAAMRTACLAELKTPYDQSWRLLAQCLEAQTLAGLDKREIKTAETPAGADAAAPVAVAVPPVPVGGVPMRGPAIPAARDAGANGTGPRAGSSAPADMPGMPAPLFGVPMDAPKIQ